MSGPGGEPSSPSSAVLRALASVRGAFPEETPPSPLISKSAEYDIGAAQHLSRQKERNGMTRLEFYLKTGNVQEVIKIIGNGDRRRLPIKWDYGLFEEPPQYSGAEMVVPGYDDARRVLVSALGNVGITDPHNGFKISLNNPQPFGQRITGPIAAWRAANPTAIVANVMARSDLIDSDFVHFVGIKALNITACDNQGLTSAAFANLRGIHTLWMVGCNQPTITDAAFTHLRGIHTLHMSRCNQPTITDAAFKNLTGIFELSMGHCDQDTITGDTLKNLLGVRSLCMFDCKPEVITKAIQIGLPVEKDGGPVRRNWPTRAGRRRKTKKVRNRRRRTLKRRRS